MLDRKIFFRNVKILVILLTVLTVLSSCFFGTPVEKTVTPTIRAIGIPTDINIGSISLTVSDADGVIIAENTFSALSTELTIAVPEGNDLNFELTVQLADAFIALPTTVATSYKGTTTADITEDSAVITLNMGVGSTKIVVPDPEWGGALPSPRLLQFDAINDTSADILDSSNPLISALLVANGEGQFKPYDVDFDNEGRIYIANYDGSSSGIIRVDNIFGTNPFFINTGSFTHSLTIDRALNIIYYMDGGLVYSCDLDGNNPDEQTDIVGESINGLTYSDGFLFTADSGMINKYDISTKTIINSTSIPEIDIPDDILVKGDKIFLANMWGSPGEQILEFNTSDLSLTGNYGTSTSSIDTTAGMFYGPRRFVAEMNDEITIIDDSTGNFLDKIIQMDNIQGDGWLTLPASPIDDGQLLFLFFSNPLA